MCRFSRVRGTTQTGLRGTTAPKDVATLPAYAFEAFQRHSRRSQDPRSHQQHLENHCFTIVKPSFFIFMLNAFSTVQAASRPPREVGKAPQGAPEGPQIGQARAQDAPKSAKKKIENAPRPLPSAPLGEIFAKKRARVIGVSGFMLRCVFLLFFFELPGQSRTHFRPSGGRFLTNFASFEG